MVLLDFSKAFDTVDHKIMCNKLLSFFNFYVSAANKFGAIFKIVINVHLLIINNCHSNVLPAKSDVPQCSVLIICLQMMFKSTL